MARQREDDGSARPPSIANRSHGAGLNPHPRPRNAGSGLAGPAHGAAQQPAPPPPDSTFLPPRPRRIFPGSRSGGAHAAVPASRLGRLLRPALQIAERAAQPSAQRGTGKDAARCRACCRASCGDEDAGQAGAVLAEAQLRRGRAGLGEDAAVLPPGTRRRAAGRPLMRRVAWTKEPGGEGGMASRVSPLTHDTRGIPHAARLKGLRVEAAAESASEGCGAEGNEGAMRQVHQGAGGCCQRAGGVAANARAEWAACAVRSRASAPARGCSTHRCRRHPGPRAPGRRTAW